MEFPNSLGAFNLLIAMVSAFSMVLFGIGDQIDILRN
jgi:hypothetical protein